MLVAEPKQGCTVTVDPTAKSSDSAARKRSTLPRAGRRP
jgi:hypothetical protein